MKKAVISLSGGLDSTTCAYIAKSQGYELYGLSVNYGQTLRKELDCAKLTAAKLEFKEHKIIDLTDLKQIAKSALTRDDIDIPDNRGLHEMTKKIPSTYVPGRNMIFLAIAASYAESIGAERIFIGVNQLDYSGYTDCRSEFINAMQTAINQACACVVNKEQPIEIVAPLLWLNKRDIIRKGISLGVDYGDTWSCYKGGGKACGNCDSCKLRLNGFKEAGKTDPIEYN